MRYKNSINVKTRRTIFAAIRAFGTYHNHIPIQQFQTILKREGLILLQDDFTEFSGMLCGDNSETSFPIGVISTEYKLPDCEGCKFYEPIENSVFRISWYKMNDIGCYEIVAYAT